MGSPRIIPSHKYIRHSPPEKGCAVFNASPGDRGERLTCIYGLYIFKALSPFLVHLRAFLYRRVLAISYIYVVLVHIYTFRPILFPLTDIYAVQPFYTTQCNEILRSYFSRLRVSAPLTNPMKSRYRHRLTATVCRGSNSDSLYDDLHPFSFSFCAFLPLYTS